MASTITALAPTLFAAAQEVSAEPFGAVDSINATFSDQGVAKGDKVTVPIAPVQANTGFTASNVYPEGTSVTAASTTVEITKSQKNSMVLTGEQIRSLENGGNYQEWTRQWAAQAMRALRNEAEIDACYAIKIGASRAAGVAGTTPFASSLSELTAVRQILRDNGAPMADPQMLVSSNSEVNLLNLGIIQQAYAAGSDAERRAGRVARQMGFNIKASAGLTLHDSGSAASYVTDTTGGTKAIGTTSFVLDTGTDTVNPGDVFTLADAGSYQYVTNIGLTDPGTIYINRPGLRQAVAQNKALTFTADYTPNLAFERNAVVGIMRPPLMPANPTIRQMVVTDGYGMSYLFVEISQYGQITWEMHLAWGFQVVQPEHVAILMG